jgi:orotidine-5'-phosphate decarboxylase
VVQSAVAGPGHRVEDELIAAIGGWNNRLTPGQIGPIGAVVGPTHFDAPLDLLGANGLFLAPGVGAQGATPADVARVFATCPDRVMPSASRSLLEGGPDLRRLRDGALALASGLHQALRI